MIINTKDDFVKTAERAIKDGLSSPYGTLWYRDALDYIRRIDDEIVINDCVIKMVNEHIALKVRVDWVAEYLELKNIK